MTRSPTAVLAVCCSVFLAAPAQTASARDAVSEQGLVDLLVGKCIRKSGDKICFQADGSYVVNGRDAGTYRLRNSCVFVSFKGGGTQAGEVFRDGKSYRWGDYFKDAFFPDKGVLLSFEPR